MYNVGHTKGKILYTPHECYGTTKAYWEILENEIWKLSLTMYGCSRKPRLCAIMGMETLTQMQSATAVRMSKRLRARSTARRGDDRAKQGPCLLKEKHVKLKLDLGWTKEKIWESRKDQERRVKRKRPTTEGQREIPALRVSDHWVRRALVFWYCETFSRNQANIIKKPAKRREEQLPYSNKYDKDSMINTRRDGDGADSEVAEWK